MTDSHISPRSLDIHSGTSVNDAHPLSASQKRILLLLALAVLMDGFDVQAMGFVAPAIIREWSIDKAMLGPVFGAGLFGMLVGSLSLGPLADRIGRRPVLVVATLFFSACMLATPAVTTVQSLWLVRFATGIGLGAIMPNAMALAGEISPLQSRVSLMMLVSGGFTAGAVVGGLVSAALIPHFGWGAVFYVGGVVPLVVGIAMWFVLPESHLFRAARAATTVDLGPNPVAALFREGRARQTLLIWGVNFCNLINLYFLSNWLPTIATAAGMSASRAVLLGTCLQLGGVAGTIAMSGVIDRWGFRRVLLTVFSVAAVAIALIGQPRVSATFLFVVVATAGFCVVGGQPAINAMAAEFYPTPLRSTGLGWSLGVGRIGSILGPVVGGVLIAFKWSNEALFLAVAAPALLSAVCVLFLRRDRRLPDRA